MEWNVDRGGKEGITVNPEYLVIQYVQYVQSTMPNYNNTVL